MKCLSPSVSSRWGFFVRLSSISGCAAPVVISSEIEFFMKFFALFFLASFFAVDLPAQVIRDPEQAWYWTRVEGELDSSQKNPLLYSMEVHYRLKQDFGQFNQLLLRPMVGYRLNTGETVWIGYTFVEFDRAGVRAPDHFAVHRVHGHEGSSSHPSVNEAPVGPHDGAGRESR